MNLKLYHLLVVYLGGVSFSLGLLNSSDKNSPLYIYFQKEPGDIMGNFKLLQRMDALGMQMEYAHDYYLNAVLNIGSPDTVIADEEVENGEMKEGQITLLDQVRLDKNSTYIRNGSYYLDSNIFIGGHGEIWRAHHISSEGIYDKNISYVLKRMHVRGKPEILRCALREIYFGEQLKGNSKIARYVSYFKTDDDYWLVFRDEGVSLQHLLYAITFHGQTSVLEPSAVWRRLRTSDSNGEGMRGILHQLISGLVELHKHGITHRDVKPSNILLNAESVPKLLIADFSSAISNNVLENGLYGEKGPSIDEESPQYMPPEVIFSDGSPYDEHNPESYDSWSVGVVLLEMIVGTANVFSVDQRTAALISHRLRNSGDEAIKQALTLAAMADYCIYNPQAERASSSSSTTGGGVGGYHDREKSVVMESVYRLKRRTKHAFENTVAPNTAALASLLQPVTTSMRCGTTELATAIQRRDPLGLGFHDKWGLDLLSRLCQWNASHRIALKDALLHAYFLGPFKSDIDGSEHALDALRREHDLNLVREWNLEPLIETDDSTELSNTLECNECEMERDVSDMKERDLIVHGIESLSSTLQRLMSRSLPIPFTTRHHHANETWYNALPCTSCDKETRTRTRTATSDHNEDDGADNSDTNPYQGSQEEYEDGGEDYSQDDATAVRNFGDVSITVDPVHEINFTCPKCGRVFPGDWNSCNVHVHRRGHGSRCLYDHTSPAIPVCLSEHSMLPLDAQSGWCDLRGRRKHIEDAHAVVFAETYKFLAVFDGHYGSRASKFASRHLHEIFDSELLKQQTSSCSVHSNDSEDTQKELLWNNVVSTTGNQILLAERLPKTPHDIVVISHQNHMKDMANETVVPCASTLEAAGAVSAIHNAFIRTHETFLLSHPPSERSGSTATVAVLFPNHLMVAHVGDSRAVLCCDANGLAVQLTLDHTPYDVKEASRVQQRGGFVEHYGVLRVNGKLAVTRSLGDKSAELSDILSQEPDITMIRLREEHKKANVNGEGDIYHHYLGKSHSHSHSHSHTSILNDILSDNNYTSCVRYNRLLDHLGLRSDIGDISFLIIASDGLWDVMSNQEATDFVCEHLINEINTAISFREDNDNENISKGIVPVDAMHGASRLLAQEAFIRGSMDNIGVCIVGLPWTDVDSPDFSIIFITLFWKRETFGCQKIKLLFNKNEMIFDHIVREATKALGRTEIQPIPNRRLSKGVNPAYLERSWGLIFNL
eukprot:gene203-366_t